ncbi:MAG: phospholipase D family protein [Rhodospirillales bacterium]|nr:phospholipase D family protein [Rhodospirillales bacterium]
MHGEAEDRPEELAIPSSRPVKPSLAATGPRRLRRLAALLAALILLAAPARAAALEACFAPPLPGGCDPTAALIGAFDAARSEIRVQIYTLTARPIVAALLRAHRRGVDVRAIVDRSALRDDPADARAVARLAAGGIAVRIDTVPGLMHDKIAIVDRAIVLTGSFNYTYSAEHRNAENLLILRDPALAALYLRNWDAAAARARGQQDRGQAVPAARAAGPSGAVRGNRHSMIYQWPGCPYYDRIAPANRVEFASAAAARAAGYRPARGCDRPARFRDEPARE